MPHLPPSASDEELIRFVDRWAQLMEQEDYSAAFDYTAQHPKLEWSPEVMRTVVKTYGDADPRQRVTAHGQLSSKSHVRKVTRWPRNHWGAVGEIWYDLNIDGLASDLTATFYVVQAVDGLVVQLNDIRMM
jgi:hypothetical protein